MEEMTADMDQMKKIVQVQVVKPTSSDVPVHLKNSVLMWTGNVMEGKTAEMPRMKKIVQIPHPHPPHPPHPHQPHHHPHTACNAPETRLASLPRSTTSAVWTESAPSVTATTTALPTPVVDITTGDTTRTENGTPV